MLDIGFSEVLLIFVIALVVLGPEKLPRLASQVGRWIGRARAMARQFREQLEEEVNLEEVRRAQETKPKKPADTEPTAAGGAATGTYTASGAASDLHTETGATTPATGNDNGAAASPGAYTGPDPADFRADTFSHAHPTDEHGSNPLTADGSAPQESPYAATKTGTAAAPGMDVPAATEATVSSAQTEASAVQSNARPTTQQPTDGTEAYPLNPHPAAPASTEEPSRRPAIEGAETHGQS
jgi:sec-independent protein translocase protein TatB